MGNINQLYDYEDKTFFMGKPAEGFWLRTDKYHFIWDIGHGKELLFDMENDPANDYNIANKNKKLIQGFKRKINRWNEEQQGPVKPGELDKS